MLPETYAPAEDTLLLIEGLEHVRAQRALEMGTGPGYVALALAARAGYVVASEVSRAALARAREVLGPVRERTDLVLCDRAQAFRDACFDFICFNPPYVGGGPVGDETTDAGTRAQVPLAFVLDALRALSGGGRVLFVLSSLTPPGPVLRAVRSMGLACSPLKAKRLFFEQLYLMAVEK